MMQRATYPRSKLPSLALSFVLRFSYGAAGTPALENDSVTDLYCKWLLWILGSYWIFHSFSSSQMMGLLRFLKNLWGQMNIKLA